MRKVLLILGALLICIIAFFAYIKLKNPSQPKVENSDIAENTVTVQSDPIKGQYLADSEGKTLYTSDNDPVQKSTCYSDCAKSWVPYYTKSKASPTETTENIAKTKPSNINVYQQKVKVPEAHVVVPQTHIDIPDTPVNHVTKISRDDGTSQYSYKGHALYRYSGDKNPKDIKGDNISQSWHVARP